MKPLVLALALAFSVAAPATTDPTPGAVMVDRSAVAVAEIPGLLEAWTARGHQGKGLPAAATVDIFVKSEVEPEKLATAMYALLNGAGHGTSTNKKGATTIGGKSARDPGDPPVVYDKAKLAVRQIQAPPGKVIQAVAGLVDRPVLVYYGGVQTPQILKFEQGTWTKSQLWSQLQTVLKANGATVGGDESFLLVWFP